MFNSLMLKSLKNLFIQISNNIKLLFVNQSLVREPALARQSFPNLLIERLYYADGRQNPSHPLHGSYSGLIRA